jgi:hypothetical protein
MKGEETKIKGSDDECRQTITPGDHLNLLAY